MFDEISLASTNNISLMTRSNNERDFVLNSFGQETTLLMSTSQFEFGSEAGDVEEEDYYNFLDDISMEDDASNFDLDSDFDEYVLDDIKPKTKPASKTAIEGLEKVKINEGSESLHRTVCMEELQMGMEARRLPCSHIYHGGCIIEWLKNSNMCPLCRHKLPVIDFDLIIKMPDIDFDYNLNMHSDVSSM